MTTSNGDDFCAIETANGAALDYLKKLAEESEPDRLHREAYDALRSLRRDFDNGELDQFRLIEKGKRVLDEFFAAFDAITGTNFRVPQQ